MNTMNTTVCPATGVNLPQQTFPTMPWATINMPNQSMTGQNTMPSAQAMPGQATLPANWLPETMIHPIYTPAFLLKNLGSLVRVEFLIGNSTTDRVGILAEVGASYIVLNSLEGNSRIMCDLFAIKFVTIISQDATTALMNTYSSGEVAADAGVLMAAAGR